MSLHTYIVWGSQTAGIKAMGSLWKAFVWQRRVSCHCIYHADTVGLVRMNSFSDLCLFTLWNALKMRCWFASLACSEKSVNCIYMCLLCTPQKRQDCFVIGWFVLCTFCMSPHDSDSVTWAVPVCLRPSAVACWSVAFGWFFLNILLETECRTDHQGHRLERFNWQKKVK